MTAEFRANAYAYALLSVTDLTTALDLWVGRFGMQIVALNGLQFSGDEFKAALKLAQTPGNPLQLIVKQGKAYRTLEIDYRDGLRYPQLEKVGEAEGSLDRLLQARSQ